MAANLEPSASPARPPPAACLLYSLLLTACRPSKALLAFFLSMLLQAARAGQDPSGPGLEKADLWRQCPAASTHALVPGRATLLKARFMNARVLLFRALML